MLSFFGSFINSSTDSTVYSRSKLIDFQSFYIFLRLKLFLRCTFKEKQIFFFLSQESSSEDKEATQTKFQGKNIVTQIYCSCERKKKKNADKPCNKKEERNREKREGRRKGGREGGSYII